MQMAALVTAIFLITSCNDSNKQQPPLNNATSAAPQPDDLTLSKIIGSISDRVQGASGGVQQALGPQGQVLQEKTKDEMEKLFRWEYRVVDLPDTSAAEEFERRLMELGDQGWECFSISPVEGSTRVTCKRRPRSALAYLKLIPGL